MITLLPKKGDLCNIKNWRPVSLLCSDYKLLSKTLANRLKTKIGSVVHTDQSYCVPERSIFDNLFLLRDLFNVSKVFNVDFGLISLDQEKAFDRVDHEYLFRVLKAFGFGPVFNCFIRLLYHNVFSVVKINNSLTVPFPVQRGIRQGCSLSGMLYALSIEPLLHQLREKLLGLAVPAAPNATPIKLSAYADDLSVFVTTDQDVAVLESRIIMYEKATSARVNWAKSEAFLVGSWEDTTPPLLPSVLSWSKTGVKLLGIYFGNEQFMQQNWEGLLDRVKGRLQSWQWLLSQLSFRGRVLIINNLVASMLWHKLVCLEPPLFLLNEIQKCLVQFFWSGHHWLRPAVLYPPCEEGGQGLIDIHSRMAAFRLQAAQRLLYTPQLSWRDLAFCLLQKAGRLGFDRHLFLISLDCFSDAGLEGFYKNLLNAWRLLKITRSEESQSTQWVFEEPLFFNPIFKCEVFSSVFFIHFVF